MNRQTDVAETAAAVRDAYPTLPWARIAECDRALNWELWHGPLPADYWTHAEPLDVYRWQGWERACDDLRAMLDPLPAEGWVDLDSGCVTALDPDDDPYNWTRPKRYGPARSRGPRSTHGGRYCAPNRSLTRSKEMCP